MSNLGLGGLMSGINTDDILSKLMQIENARIDIEKAKKADLAAKQDAWHKVKSSLETLRTKLDGVRFAGSFRARKATFSDETVASATVSASATLTTHKLSVTQLAQAEVVGGKALTKAQAEAPLGLTVGDSFKVNGQAITLDGTETLYTLRDKINNTANVNVKAEVIKVTKATGDEYSLTLTAKTTGAAGMTLENVTGDSLYTLGLDKNVDPTLITKNTLTVPQNALFMLDNRSYETTTNAINDAIPGLALTLKKADPAGADTDITVEQNTDAVTETVKAWVGALNSSMDMLRSYTKFDGSTKEKGLLNGDSLARNILTSLRSIVSADVTGLPVGSRSLADVGITTGGWGTDDFGKVVVDADKLVAKLTADEDAVARIFGGIRVENNLALAPAASASDGNLVTTAGNAIDGQTTTSWESAAVPTALAPQTLTINLGSVKSIDQINLYNPDGADSPTAGLKDFKLSYWNATTGEWKEIQSVTGSTGASRSFSFNPINTDQIKLDVTATYYNTATSSDTNARVSELQVLEQNRGTAIQMYRFVNSTLTAKTGALDVRDDSYDAQIKNLDEKISQMAERMAGQQERLKAQFDRMEQALSKIQSQGAQLAAMMGGYQK